MKIVVYDDDSLGGVQAQELVDFFQFDGAHIPLAQDEASAKFITVFPQSIINDQTQYTQLRLRIRVGRSSVFGQWDSYISRGWRIRDLLRRNFSVYFDPFIA